MATINAYSSVDLITEQMTYGTVTAVTATKIEITAGAYVARYLGNFSYDDYGVYGQLTGYTVHYGGALQVSISGINVDAYRFINAIDNSDANAAYNMVLGASDTFHGSGGADRFRGFNGHDLMNGNGGNDRLVGDSGNDRIYGGIGADVMEGGAGADIIHAGSGYDVLVGGAGRDVLHGGTDASADAFVYRSSSDSAVGPGHDTIFNFTRTMDDIDLRAIDARPTASGNQAFAFSGQTAAANSVWWKALDTGGVVVRADMNGDRVADFEIIVKGANWLTADNFLL